MSVLTGKKPAEKIKDAAQQAAKADTTSPPTREYLTLTFQVALLSAIAAFAVLTFMVKATPLFTLDVQITHLVQSINSPIFAALMSWISWPGFPPPSFIISALLVLLLYGFGLQWESLAAFVAAL